MIVQGNGYTEEGFGEGFLVCFTETVLEML